MPSKTEILVKSVLWGSASMLPKVMGLDEAVSKPLELFIGWMLSSHQSNLAKKNEKEPATLDEIELNGHLLGLAALSTDNILEKAERTSAEVLGDDVDEKALSGLRQGIEGSWRSFAAGNSLDGQDFKDIITHKTSGGDDLNSFDAAFWEKFLDHALRERKLENELPGGFLVKLAVFFEKEFPSKFYENAKQAAAKKPEAFAALQLQFFGSLAAGQSEIKNKLDGIAKQLREVGGPSETLKARQITRLAQVANQLHHDFSELRPQLEEWSKNLNKDIGEQVRPEIDRSIRVIKEEVRHQSDLTRRTVHHGTNKVLLAFAVVAVIFGAKFWLDHRAKESAKLDDEHSQRIQSIEASNLSLKEKREAKDEENRRYAKAKGIPVEQIKTILTQEAAELAQEATKLWHKVLTGNGKQEDYDQAIANFLKAGDNCLVAEAPDQAKRHYEQAMAVTQSTSDDVGQSVVHRKLATLAYVMKNPTLARQHRMEAVEILIRMPNKEAYLAALIDLVDHLYQTGEHKLALDRSNEMVAWLEKNKEDFGADRHKAMHLHGTLLAELNQSEKAATYYEQAIQIHDGTTCKDGAKCSTLAGYKLDHAIVLGRMANFMGAQARVDEVAAIKSDDPQVEFQLLRTRIRLMLLKNSVEDESTSVKRERSKEAHQSAKELLQYAKSGRLEGWQSEVTALDLLAAVEEGAGMLGEAVGHMKEGYAIVVSHEGEGSRGSLSLAKEIADVAGKAGGEWHEDAAHFQKIVDEKTASLNVEDGFRKQTLYARIMALIGSNNIKLARAMIPELEKSEANSAVKDPMVSWGLHLIRGIDAMAQGKSSSEHLEAAMKACDSFPKEINSFKAMTTAIRGVWTSAIGNPEGYKDIDRAYEMIQNDSEDAVEAIKPLLDDWQPVALAKCGQYQRAIPLLVEAVQALRKDGPAASSKLAEKLCFLAEAYSNTSNGTEADKLYLEAAGLLSGMTEPWSADNIAGMVLHIARQIGSGHADQVIDLLEETLHQTSLLYGDDSLVMAHVLHVKVLLLNTRSEYSEAADVGRKVIGMMLSQPMPAGDDDLLASLEPYSFAVFKVKSEADLQLLKSAAVEVMKRPVDDSTENARRFWRLSDNMAAAGLIEEALPLGEKAIQMDAKVSGPATSQVARDLNNVSLMLFNLKRFSQSEESCRKAVSILLQLKNEGDAEMLLQQTTKNYIGCVKAMGHSEDAARERIRRLSAGEALEALQMLEKGK